MEAPPTQYASAEKGQIADHEWSLLDAHHALRTRGEHALKGVPGSWALYAVSAS